MKKKGGLSSTLFGVLGHSITLLTSQIMTAHFFVMRILLFSLLILIPTLAIAQLTNSSSQELLVTSAVHGKLRQLSHISSSSLRAVSVRRVRIRFPIPKKGNIQVELKPVQILTDDYRSEVTSSAGVRSLSRPAIQTFEGRLLGHERADFSRLSIDASKNGKRAALRGMFRVQSKYFAVGTPNKKGKLAQRKAQSLIEVREVTQMSDVPLGCAEVKPDETGHLPLISRPVVAAPMSNTVAAATTRTLEIGTEADYAFAVAAGGMAAANSLILQTINWVDGVYQRDLGISVRIRYQHGWSTPDVYAAPMDVTSFLYSFRNYAVQNLDPTSKNDHMQMFTNRGFPKSPANITGLAFVGGVCGASRFGVSVNTPQGSSVRMDNINSFWGPLTAHEIGHDIGAGHYPADGNPPVTNPTAIPATFPRSIMFPLLNTVNSFHPVSIAEVNKQLSSYYSQCLLSSNAPEPGPTVPSGPVPVPPTATPLPPATPIPTGVQPIGTCDSATWDVNGVLTIRGWTCDRDARELSLQVHVYKISTVGQTSFVGQSVANLTRESAVASACGSQSLAHGFAYQVSGAFQPGEKVAVYGLNINAQGQPSGANAILTSCPLVIPNHPVNTPVPPTPTPTRVPGVPTPATSTSPIGWCDGIANDASDGTTITGWTCDADSRESSLKIQIYRILPSGQTLLLTTTDANGVREAAVASLCGSQSTRHGFSTRLTGLSAGDKLSVYGVNINQSGLPAGTNTLLSDCPKTVPAKPQVPPTIPAPVPPTPITPNTPGGPPTPIPGTSSVSPIGWCDGAYADGTGAVVLSGWTCDPDSRESSLQLQIFKLLPSGQSSFIASTIANGTRESAVAAACGSQSLVHGIRSRIVGLQQGDKVNIYPININGAGQPAGTHSPLQGCPLIIPNLGSVPPTAVPPTTPPTPIPPTIAPPPTVAPPPTSGNLPPPTGVQASDRTSANSIRVSWNSVEGAKEYWVYRSLVSTTEGTRVGVVVASSRLFQDLVKGVYFYGVKTISPSGVPSALSFPDKGSTASIAASKSNKVKKPKKKARPAKKAKALRK